MLKGHACICIGVLYVVYHSPLIRIGGGDTSPKNMRAVFKVRLATQ